MIPVWQCHSFEIFERESYAPKKVDKKYRCPLIPLSIRNSIAYIRLHFVKRISHAFIPECSMRQIVFIDACL